MAKKMKSLFVSHDLNSRNDNKILKLRMEHGWAGYGLFWALVEMLGETTDYQLPTDFKSLAFGLQADENLLRSVIEEFDLFVIKADFFYSKSLRQRMKIKESERKKKSDAGKKGNEIRWDKEREKEQAAQKAQPPPLQTTNSKNDARAAQWMRDVFGDDEVEQDQFRNKAEVWEV
jgi:hypothetical protein